VSAVLNVVVVSYKNRGLLEKCVKSIYASLKDLDLKSVVTVVDNASRDGTRELVREHFPEINYIENKENMGSARAFNIGVLSRKDATYTLLMNDDVELFPDTIRNMLDTLASYPAAKGVPANLFRPDGSEQKMKLGLIGLRRERSDKTRFVQFGGTTTCLYYTDVLLDLGLFDGYYFFYNEDLDLSLRAKRKGIRFVFNPRIKVVHYKGYGRKKGEKQIKPNFYAANYYFYRKNFGPVVACIFLLAAHIHIIISKRRFVREKSAAKLDLLEQGREKLAHAVKNFKTLVRESYVPEV
jgi:N-acetylglucosaminyl-diphospho-decaprenol L-rhamnosyltransferase